MCTDQIEVKLNVYDLHPYNKYGYWLGLGVFHAGVEFLGKGKAPHPPPPQLSTFF